MPIKVSRRRPPIPTYKDLFIRGVLSIEWGFISNLYDLYKKLKKLPKQIRKKAKYKFLDVAAYKFVQELLNFILIMKKNKINIKLEEANRIHNSNKNTNYKLNPYNISIITLNKDGKEIDRATIYTNQAARSLTEEDYKYFIKSVWIYMSLYCVGLE